MPGEPECRLKKLETARAKALGTAGGVPDSLLRVGLYVQDKMMDVSERLATLILGREAYIYPARKVRHVGIPGRGKFGGWEVWRGSDGGAAELRLQRDPAAEAGAAPRRLRAARRAEPLHPLLRPVIPERDGAAVLLQDELRNSLSAAGQLSDPCPQRRATRRALRPASAPTGG
eukprot:gene9959-biopygen6365